MTRLLARRANSFIMLAALLVSASVRASGLELSTASGSLLEEVLSTMKDDPHRYDWRHFAVQVEAGYTGFSERNSFEASSYDVGVSRPFGETWLLRGAVRKVDVSETGSSRILAETPFSQAAQPSRYEFMLGTGYTLLDGRSATPFSPLVTDVGHALYALGGLQYNLFSSRDPEPVAGMRAVYYNVVCEIGLRWQIFLPKSLGIGLEWTDSFPLAKADPDLKSWQRFSALISWSIGE